MIGWKVVEWDQRQLRHIAEIARRVPLEGWRPWPRISGGGGSKTGGAGPGGSQGPNRSVFLHRLPELLSGRAMVPPHEVERAATGPLRRPGGVDS